MKKNTLKNNSICKKLLILVLLTASFSNTTKAQYGTATINSDIGTNEYGTSNLNTYTSGSSIWYMTWDADYLYVSIQNANETEAAIMYFDVTPATPVNGTTGAVGGTTTGIAYDGLGAPNLPFSANVAIYVKNNYREFRRWNGSSWTTVSSGDGGLSGGSNDYTSSDYSSNGRGNGAGSDDDREMRISWNRLTNGGTIPASFNWNGYMAYTNGRYAPAPLENPSGTLGAGVVANDVRYFTVTSTSNGSATNPTSRNCYTHPDSDNNSFGAIGVWDFTMNRSGRTITRTGGAWTISGTLRIDAGTISFGTIGSGNACTVGSLFNAGTLSLSSSIGGDITIQGDITDNGTFNANNRAIFFSGSNVQTIQGSGTFDIPYVRINKTGGRVVLGSNLTCVGPNGGNGMEIDGTTSILDLNGFSLILGQSSGTTNATFNSGIATPGTIRGSSTSSISVLGTGALGTILFDQTTPGTTNSLQSLTINRTSTGTVTLGSNLVTGALTLTNGNFILGSNTLTLNGAFTGSASNVITGSASSNLTIGGAAGTLFFDNTSSTTKTIQTLTLNSGGSMSFSAADNLSSSSNVVLNGGILNTAAGLAQTLGTLNLSGTSTITLGAANHTLAFAASNGITWNGTTLTINGWNGTAGASNASGPKIKFGSANTALTSTQLAKINFTGYGLGATILSDGEIVPVPSVTISNTSFAQIATQNITRNTNNNIVSRFRLDISGTSSTITSVSFPTPNNATTNNYVGGTDISIFKLFYNSSTDFNTASQLGMNHNAVNNNPTAGETISFTSLSETLTNGTYYFWLTADLPINSRANRTLTVNEPSVSLNLGITLGSSSATGVQTVIPGSNINYYLQASSAATASNFNSLANGAGTTLSSLSESDINLVIDDETNATMTGDVTLGSNSRLIISQGSSAKLTITNVNFTGTVDIGSAGTLELDQTDAQLNNLSFGTLSSGSTVSYTRSGAQTIKNVAYHHLTIGGSGTKIFASSSPTVTGNFVVSGATVTAPASITFDGTSQNIAGLAFNNVIISGSGTKTLTSSASIGVSSSLTVNTSATLATGGFLTLLSTASGSASVANSAGTITGNVNVERYIPAMGSSGIRGRFRFLASPVNNTTLADWQGETHITGTGGSTNGFDNTLLNNSSVFWYNESAGGGLNDRWEAATNTSNSIVSGRGYRVFIRGDRNASRLSGPTAPDQSEVTLNTVGTINQGSFNFPSNTVSYTGSGSDAGWCLVGNPYPSAIDWQASSGWTRTNIGTGLAIFNPQTNSYSYSLTNSNSSDGVTVSVNGGSRYIASGQGFFIRTTASSPTLSCNESVKTTNVPSNIFKTTPTNQLKLKLTKDLSNIDESVIVFGENYSNDFSENEDLGKLLNATVNISSVTNSGQLAAINFLNNKGKEMVIPVYIWGEQPGEYTFEVLQLEGLDKNLSVVLKDKFLNKTTPISTDHVVKFEITSDSNSFGSNRFEILVMNSTSSQADIYARNKVKLFVYPNPAKDFINVGFEGNNNLSLNYDVQILNYAGKKLIEYHSKTAETALNIEKLPSGIYLINVKNDSGFNETVKFFK